jgi:hypothetical protein
MQMEQRFRWIGLATVLITILASYVAYQAGVSHGLAIGSVGAGAAQGAVFYGRPWGWGFFPFGILIWLFVLRILFGGGCGARWRYRHGAFDGPDSFEDWHRRAHERMNNPPKP